MVDLIERSNALGVKLEIEKLKFLTDRIIATFVDLH